MISISVLGLAGTRTLLLFCSSILILCVLLAHKLQVKILLFFVLGNCASMDENRYS